MGVGLLRRMMKRAKVWNTVAEDVTMFPEHEREVGRALPAETIFEVAGSKPSWMVAHCAAVLAVSTTCRKVELRHVRWEDVDLFKQVVRVRRSKRDSGKRSIPLNADAMAALARLRGRSEAVGGASPEHYVFPPCEHNHIAQPVPQKAGTRPAGT